MQEILHGSWFGDTPWELRYTKDIPQRENVTAIKLICLVDDEIAFTQTHRGWELPGGHLEDQESFEEYIRRETFEEAGVVLGERLELIGVMKIRNPEGKVSASTGKPYPTPSYMLYYIGDFQSREGHTDPATLASGMLSLADERFLTASEYALIRFLLE